MGHHDKHDKHSAKKAEKKQKKEMKKMQKYGYTQTGQSDRSIDPYSMGQQQAMPANDSELQLRVLEADIAKYQRKLNELQQESASRAVSGDPKEMKKAEKKQKKQMKLREKLAQAEQRRNQMRSMSANRDMAAVPPGMYPDSVMGGTDRNMVQPSAADVAFQATSQQNQFQPMQYQQSNPQQHQQLYPPGVGFSNEPVNSSILLPSQPQTTSYPQQNQSRDMVGGYPSQPSQFVQPGYNQLQPTENQQDFLASVYTQAPNPSAYPPTTTSAYPPSTTNAYPQQQQQRQQTLQCSNQQPSQPQNMQQYPPQQQPSYPLQQAQYPNQLPQPQNTSYQ